MEIERDGKTGNVSIGHKQYIEGLLHEYGMQDCKPNATPLEVGFQTKCDSDDCGQVDKTRYQSLIGSLLYLALTTRPDIIHSVAKLAQRNSDPHKEHEVAAKRVLRYLRGTSDVRLHYSKTGVPIHCFVDADWAGDCKRSEVVHWLVIPYCWSGGVMGIKEVKIWLPSVAREAEYVALSTAAKEVIYIRKLINEMGSGRWRS
ncbi:uncharacterized protein [Drosophila tropicalis]|uniref:uncharacterized protein n=1 Tax=Drosophila tropicalis TaxID=46794 RepID=UPI0035AC0045